MGGNATPPPPPPQYHISFRLPHRGAGDWALLFVRWGLPILIAIAGVLIFALGHGDARYEGGVSLLVVSGCVWLINWLYRATVDVEERDSEEEAREFFGKHGHWPDEPPPKR
jgi:hypothetical protein